MATSARPTPYRGRDATSWVLTSLAASMLLHVAIVHYLGNVRLLDVEAFTATVARVFSVVEVPEILPLNLPPLADALPDQAERPAEPKPEAIPLAQPDPSRVGPGVGAADVAFAPPTHDPATVRLPGTTLPVLHRNGPPVIDQTLAQIGELAPSRAPGPVKPATPEPGPGRIRILAAPPELPAPAPATLDLPQVPLASPALATRLEPIELPTMEPSVTQLHRPADAPPAGLVIPLDEPDAVEQIRVPRVMLDPADTLADPGDTRPIIPFGKKEVDVDFQMYAEPGNPRCFFRLEVGVAELDKLPVIPKDVLFICDVSLSIRNAELDISRAVVEDYLRTLQRTDRFNVIIFSEDARKLYRSFVEPTPERIAEAIRFVARIPGKNRTDVYRVLQAVVRDVARHSPASRPCNLFFISDGASTAGIRDVRRIVNDIGALARPNFAIFPFDVGKGGNRYLLDLLAYRSRGAFTHAESYDEAPKLFAQLCGSYDKPVLMNVVPRYAGLKVDETYPALIPNLYANRSIVIYGRCTPAQNVAVTLHGKNPFARRGLSYEHVPGDPDPRRADIAREWARRKIHHIVAQMARTGETHELRAEIRRLGDKYRIPTLYRR